ncbi:MAG: tyrosine--tRNA ligase [Candidatus Zambryskibacteria bacterium CG22_combo_CG10-13_8_21_14_all_42_17]|uniref:Tyrosine--tRNA ligase n=1 Tax=Candidatus Zambryskibacteria bacterium CG22_combo_CG10-13_8_21_14_all_42_17 TaxID=1975118 RepID=A0A2H0BCR2_9BACT|nr:MAG: tyrosine--tRNA ligase [Candidatus Zambryskibacteria bacterium CG22_combo_CG10-13_8_21_14_all_42_17]
MNKETEDLLNRGVGEFIDPGGIFREKLEKNPEKIVIKFGIDPTRPDIHLGHAVLLRKLRQFQDLGAKVVFVVGDYTAQIGDPTGKSKVRPAIDQAEVERNMATFIEQIGKILRTDKNVFSWIRNSDWFTAITDISAPMGQKLKMTLPSGQTVDDIDANSFVGKALIFTETRMQIKDLGLKEDISVITLQSFLWMLKHVTHAKLIERDLFQERIKNQQDLYLHEMMYPILQGIDSLVLSRIYKSCDLEIGGTDQHFNMLMGRTVMRVNNEVEQSVLSLKLLEGIDGKEKMSKSLDNYIAITDKHGDMYGKVMSIPDSSIGNYFELTTFTPMDEVENIRKGLSNKSIHPKEIKMDLARQIVAIYHGERAAEEAEKNFTETFSKGGVPADIKTVKMSKDTPLVEILLEQGLVSSKTEFNRLTKSGAIKEMANGVYRIGKHRFLKIER